MGEVVGELASFVAREIDIYEVISLDKIASPPKLHSLYGAREMERGGDN